MIIATAGHVDHGKTLLVKALTGVDTDRLPDEKKRGLTIDLGFAYLEVEAGGTVGFIDVPGHERFIRNALCGLAGTDFVLLIVAADDGPMPQTHEHLAIVDLLGISNGTVALTKTDRVTPERIAGLTQEIAALLAPTALASAPIFPLSAMTMDGVPALKDHLLACARKTAARSTAHNFRLAVDRKFDVSGAGLVVTGTVFSGQIAVGDAVEVLGADMELRVRGIHAQNAKAERGVAGQRCALNLAGPELNKEKIARGDWIVTGRLPQPCLKFDAEITVLQNEAKPLAHWTPLHIHLGAAETTGRIALLEEKSLLPGETGLAQLVLDKPLGAVFADRLILRDKSAQRTMAGGRVLDVFPPRRGRAKPERIAWLRAMGGGVADHAMLARLMAVSPLGVDLDRFAQNRNLTDKECTDVIAKANAAILATPTGNTVFSAVRWSNLQKAAVKRLESWHAAAPSSKGLDGARLFEGAEIKAPRALISAIADELVNRKVLVREGLGVRLPGHTARLEGSDAKLWKTVSQSFSRAAPRPMTAREIARDIGVEARKLEAFLKRAGHAGLVARISKTRYVTTASLKELAAMADRLAAANGDCLVTVKDFRDVSGIGRNMAIEVLEYFDRQKFTQRKGEGREVLQAADKIFGTG